MRDNQAPDKVLFFFSSLDVSPVTHSAVVMNNNGIFGFLIVAILAIFMTLIGTCLRIIKLTGY